MGVAVKLWRLAHERSARTGSRRGAAKTAALYSGGGQDISDARRDRELRSELPCEPEASQAACRGSYGGVW